MMVLDKNDPNYRQCSMSVMDNIADPDITFDEKGICNYYYAYLEAEKNNCLDGELGLKKLEILANHIKNNPGKKGYNCILGLSGGVDSTYLAYLAKKLGLNPLLVHFDYGWNSEIAVKNVQNVVKRTGFDLYTYVMDWNEFRSLQRSYFKASVLDLDVPADHMIFGSLHKVAKKFKIKYILSGKNTWTEHTLPRTWNYNKFDLTNLKNIHKSFENTPLKNLPSLGYFHRIYYNVFLKINSVELLEYQYFNKNEVVGKIKEHMDWVDYGGKHHESVFTRFYQGYILPTKYNIDKRKAHLSNLIFSRQMTKNEALSIINEPTYPVILQRQDFDFVAKKLGFSHNELDEILNQKTTPHEYYGTDLKLIEYTQILLKIIKPVTKFLKKIRS
jgi:N-acetyl sugar amidotransferase